jgi:hypothetical protein
MLTKRLRQLLGTAAEGALCAGVQVDVREFAATTL